MQADFVRNGEGYRDQDSDNSYHFLLEKHYLCRRNNQERAM